MTARRFAFVGRRAACLVAALATACAVAQDGGAAEADRIAWVAESGGAFELRIWNAATRRAEAVDVMVDAPQLLVWNPERRSVASVRADGVYQAGYARAPYASDRRGEAPPKGAEPVDGWHGAGDTLAVVTVSVTATAAGGDRRRCTLFDVARKGAWVRRGDAVEDADAPGAGPCAAFADARHGAAAGRSVSSARLMRAYRCAGGHAACREPDPPSVPAALRTRMLEGSRQLDAVAALDLPGARHLVVAGIATGDTPHFHVPLQLLPRAGGAATPLVLDAGPQLQLGASGRLLLVATEYDGAAPAVVDLDAGSVVFRAAGRLATWVPR